MLRVNRNITIQDEELDYQFILAGGPGGQNVNKVATAAQLRFNVLTSSSLPETVRERLLKIASTRINKEGELIITARRYRSQERNRQDATDRLVALVAKAAVKPKPRKKKKPSLAAKKRRLDEKRKQSERKQKRKPIRYSD
jgi:ribosome-associated protein